MDYTVHGILFFFSPWNSLGQNSGVGSLSDLPNPEIEPGESVSRSVGSDSFRPHEL